MKTFRAGDLVVTDFAPGSAMYVVVDEGYGYNHFTASGDEISSSDVSSGYVFLGYHPDNLSVVMLLNNSDGRIVQLYDDEIEQLR